MLNFEEIYWNAREAAGESPFGADEFLEAVGREHFKNMFQAYETKSGRLSERAQGFVDGWWTILQLLAYIESVEESDKMAQIEAWMDSHAQ